MSKALTELSEEELLKLADGSIQTVYDWPDDILEFISVYKLKSGTNPVPTKILHKLYSVWSKNPITHHKFSRQIVDIFPSIPGDKSKSLLLEKDSVYYKNIVTILYKKNDKTKSKGWHTHFNNFINKYNIKKGILPIKDSVLYTLYSKAYFKKRHPLGFKQFVNFCKAYYKYQLIDGNNWFRLDRSIEEHLTEELIDEMKNGKKEK